MICQMYPKVIPVEGLVHSSLFSWGSLQLDLFPDQAASYSAALSLDPPPTGLDEAYHESGLVFPPVVSQDSPPAVGVGVRGTNKKIVPFVRVVSSCIYSRLAIMFQPNLLVFVL